MPPSPDVERGLFWRPNVPVPERTGRSCRVRFGGDMQLDEDMATDIWGQTQNRPLFDLVKDAQAVCQAAGICLSEHGDSKRRQCKDAAGGSGHQEGRVLRHMELCRKLCIV